MELCELPSIKDNPIKSHEDNVGYIAQNKGWFIKDNRTKQFFLSSSILTSSKRTTKLMFSKSVHVII